MDFRAARGRSQREGGLFSAAPAFPRATPGSHPHRLCEPSRRSAASETARLRMPFAFGASGGHLPTRIAGLASCVAPLSKAAGWGKARPLRPHDRCGAITSAPASTPRTGSTHVPMPLPARVIPGTSSSGSPAPSGHSACRCAPSASFPTASTCASPRPRRTCRRSVTPAPSWQNLVPTPLRAVRQDGRLSALTSASALGFEDFPMDKLGTQERGFQPAIKEVTAIE